MPTARRLRRASRFRARLVCGLSIPPEALRPRLLSEAEAHPTNLPMMERLDSLADTRLGVAALLTERERV